MEGARRWQETLLKVSLEIHHAVSPLTQLFTNLNHGVQSFPSPIAASTISLIMVPAFFQPFLFLSAPLLWK